MLNHQEIVILDIETTGLNPLCYVGKYNISPYSCKRRADFSCIYPPYQSGHRDKQGCLDRICEIGAIKIERGRAIDEFHTLINPRRPISEGASKINGITPQMVEEAPFIEDVFPDFIRFIKGRVIFAYNANFDITFINEELKNTGFSYRIDKKRVVDILMCARRFLPGLPSYALDNISDYLGISLEGAHRALADAYRAWSVFERIIPVLEKRGIRSLGEIMNR